MMSLKDRVRGVHTPSSPSPAYSPPRHLLTLLLADGSEPNSGSSTPARRLLGVPSGNNSPRDSPSGTLRRHHLNVSGSQLPADDTCDDEPVAVKR